VFSRDGSMHQSVRPSRLRSPRRADVVSGRPPVSAKLNARGDEVSVAGTVHGRKMTAPLLLHAVQAIFYDR
jgi:hypothetical protein